MVPSGKKLIMPLREAYTTTLALIQLEFWEDTREETGEEGEEEEARSASGTISGRGEHSLVGRAFGGVVGLEGDIGFDKDGDTEGE